MTHRRHSRRVLGHVARSTANTPRLSALVREALRTGGYVVRRPGEPWRLGRPS